MFSLDQGLAATEGNQDFGHFIGTQVDQKAALEGDDLYSEFKSSPDFNRARYFSRCNWPPEHVLVQVSRVS